MGEVKPQSELVAGSPTEALTSLSYELLHTVTQLKEQKLRIILHIILSGWIRTQMKPGQSLFL